MALLCGRLALNGSRRNFYVSASKLADKMMADPLEHATGLEKRELLAALAGNDDPYYSKALKRAPTSSKASPNIVCTAFDKRIIGCVCQEDATHIKWMWLYLEDGPKRCQCGHWFKLVQKPAL